MEEARRIADRLVETRLAACAAITPKVLSIYRWKGAIESSEEWGLTIKTRRDLFEALCVEIRKLHSYEVPEILALPIIAGSEDYLNWLDAALAQPELPSAGPL